MIIRLTSTQVGRLALKQRLDRYPVAINLFAINSLRAKLLSTDADLNSMRHLAVEHRTSPESWRGSEQLSSKGVPTTCQTVHLPSFSGIHTRSAVRFVLSCTYSSSTAAACISITLTRGNLLTRSGRATLSNATNNCYFVIGISPKGADRKFAQLSRGLFSRILAPTLDNAERSKQLAPRHFNSIGAVCNSQTSGIAAFLSRIGRPNTSMKGIDLVTVRFYWIIEQVIENTRDVLETER